MADPVFVLEDNRVSGWGDSRTAQNWITTNLNQPAPLARGYLWWFEALSQRVRLTSDYNQGLSGDTIAELWGRLQNDTANARGIKPSQVVPGIAVLLVGTNSVTGGLAVTTMMSTFLQVLNWLVTRGFKVMVINEWPRGGDGANSGLLSPTNQKLMYGLAEAMRRLRGMKSVWVVDVWPRVADPARTDCRPLPNMLNPDDLHNSPGVAYITGQELARVASEEMGLPRLKLCPASNGDRFDATLNLKGCLNSNPMLVLGAGGTLGTGASGQVPEGYTLSAAAGLAVVGSFVTVQLEGNARQAYRLAITGTPTGNNAAVLLRQTGLLASVQANDVLDAGYEVLVGAGHVNFAAPGLMLDTSVAATRAHGGLSITGDRQMAAQAVQGFYAVPRACEYPVGTSLPSQLNLELRPYFSLAGVASAATVDVLSCWVRKK